MSPHFSAGLPDGGPRFFREYLWISLLLVLLSASLAGFCSSCGHGDQVVAELGGAVASVARNCGPSALSTYNDIRSAVHGGGSAWISVVFDALGCIEPVIRDELQAHGIQALDEREIAHLMARLEASDRGSWVLAGMDVELEGHLLASAIEEAPSPSVTPVHVSKGELRRARLAIALERVVLKTQIKGHRP